MGGRADPGDAGADDQHIDVDTHFNPPYNPWDQRMCAAQDGDFFTAIRDGRAAVATGAIKRFVRDGIELESGEKIEADLVVTATGLEMVPFAGIGYAVDGRPIDLSETVTYKGMMLTGMPNFVYAVGYTNASWTLKVDGSPSPVCSSSICSDLCDGAGRTCSRISTSPAPGARVGQRESGNRAP